MFSWKMYCGGQEVAVAFVKPDAWHRFCDQEWSLLRNHAFVG